MTVHGRQGSTAYCKELSTAGGLRAARELWEELFQDCSRATPCASWEWAQQWWQHFRVWPGEDGAPDPAARLLLLAVFDARNRPIGLAPFLVVRDRASWLGRRDLRLLGDLGGAGCGFSEEPLLLLRLGHEQQAIEAILQYFLDRRRGLDWDVLNFQFPRWNHSSHNAESIDSLRWSGLKSRLFKAEETHMQMLSLPATWAEFRGTLTKSMRDNLTYYPRLLTRHGHNWQLRLARTPQEVAGSVETLVDLHHLRAHSSRGLRHTDYLPLPEHRQLLRQALPRLAAEGMATIFQLEVDGQVVAALAVLENAGELTIYISGFDPAWYDYSPLLILTTETIKYAIERGLQKVNFMCGPMASKSRWGAGSDTTIQRLVYVRPRLRSLLRVLLYARAHRGDGDDAATLEAGANSSTEAS